MMARHDIIDGKNVLRLRFEDGEMLEMHEHTLPNYHDMSVVSGRAALYGDGWYKEVGVGEALLLTDREMRHEIKALEPNTEVLNIYRYPMPNHAKRVSLGWFEASGARE